MGDNLAGVGGAAKGLAASQSESNNHTFNVGLHITQDATLQNHENLRYAFIALRKEL